MADVPPDGVPVDGMNYNVVVGDTVTGGADDHYHVLQYGFKPASIDRAQEGLLRKTENGALEVEFANPGKPPDNKAYFKGQYTPCKEYECILIFDSATSTFRLERLMGQGKSLKLVRREATTKNTSVVQESAIPEPDHAVRGRGRPKLAETPLPPIMSVYNNNSNGSTASGGTSPPEDILDDGSGGPAAKKRRQTKAPAANKRVRKAAAKPHTEKQQSIRDSTEDLLALVDQIESSVDAKPEAASAGEEEEEEDFLAEAFESDLESQSSQPETASTSFAPPPATTPSFPSSSSHPLPASKPRFPPASFPSHPPASHPFHPPPQQPLQQNPFGFPTSQFPGMGFPNANGGVVPPANGANGNDDGSSDSGSESESASESESESESDSESASESESENE